MQTKRSSLGLGKHFGPSKEETAAPYLLEFAAPDEADTLCLRRRIKDGRASFNPRPDDMHENEPAAILAVSKNRERAAQRGGLRPVCLLHEPGTKTQTVKSRLKDGCEIRPGQVRQVLRTECHTVVHGKQEQRTKGRHLRRVESMIFGEAGTERRHAARLTASE